MTAEEPKTTHERSPNQAPNQAPTAGRDPVAGASKPQPGMPASAMPDLQSPADRTTSAVRPPLTDSPWFWVCMFATAALLGLTAAQPKYGRRQAQIEKQYQGREFSVRGRAGTESNQPYSTPDDTLRLTGYSSSQVTFDTNPGSGDIGITLSDGMRIVFGNSTNLGLTAATIASKISFS